MKGIYYKEGVFVVIDNDEEHDSCVYHENYKADSSLFGGRIEMKKYGNYEDSMILTVDGINIIELDTNSYGANGIVNKLNKAVSISKVTSCLNAIEANGVDAFIQHYKKGIEFLYAEVKELNQRTESLLPTNQVDLNIQEFLLQIRKLRSLLSSVLAILFSLHTYMASGLENEKVKSVCQSIMDSI